MDSRMILSYLLNKNNLILFAVLKSETTFNFPWVEEAEYGLKEL